MNLKDVKSIFTKGEIITIGTQKKDYKITVIDDKKVVIESVDKGTSYSMSFDKLNVVYNYYNKIDSKNITQSVFDLMKENGLFESKSETALYNFVTEFKNRIKNKRIIITEKEFYEEFETKVKNSSKLTSEERIKRIEDSVKSPNKKTVTTEVYDRNPDVVAETLYRAKGLCEKCNKAAPFKREDGSPYLEVHHIILLSKGGPDHPKNTKALCPNCHREVHFGAKN